MTVKSLHVGYLNKFTGVIHAAREYETAAFAPAIYSPVILESDYLSLAAENSSLRLTIDNIVNALKLGDGPVAQQVIELVNGLVEENSVLKKFPDQITGFIRKLGTSEMGHDTREIIENAVKRLKTISTDAAIAEIKAQGVDEFVIYATAPRFTEHELTVEDAEEFAANLRAGGKAS